MQIQHRPSTRSLLDYVSVADQEYWYEQARIALRKRLQYATDRRPHAKNVLLFVGDGMGVSTATAARILRGQRLGKPGEEHELAWDAFPTVALAKVRAQRNFRPKYRSSETSSANCVKNWCLFYRTIPLQF